LNTEDYVLKKEVLDTLDREAVCSPVGRFVSDDDDKDTIHNVYDDIEEEVDKTLVAANVLGTVEELEIIPDAVEKYVVDGDITHVSAIDWTELKLETLLLAVLEMLL
jgi:hypothetical protein